MRSAVVPFVFAAILLAGGFYAYSASPESANAATALIVPGICAGIMLLFGLGLIAAVPGRMGLAKGLHITAVILSLVFMIAFVSRAIPTVKQANAYRIAEQEYRQKVEDGQLEETPEDRAAHFEEFNAENPSIDVPDHNKMYLALTLFTLSGVAALAFVGMLATPPRAGKKLSPSDVRTPSPAESRQE